MNGRAYGVCNADGGFVCDLRGDDLRVDADAPAPAQPAPGFDSKRGVLESVEDVVRGAQLRNAEWWALHKGGAGR